MKLLPHALTIHRSNEGRGHKLRWFILIAAAVCAIAWRTRTAIARAPRRLEAAFGGPGTSGHAISPGQNRLEQTSEERASAPPATVQDHPVSNGEVPEVIPPAAPNLLESEPANGNVNLGHQELDRLAVKPVRALAGIPASVNWVASLPDGSCPDDYPIKGNANSHIYHLPGESSYGHTHAECCFASADDASAAGYRPRARR